MGIAMGIAWHAHCIACQQGTPGRPVFACGAIHPAGTSPDVVHFEHVLAEVWSMDEEMSDVHGGGLEIG